MEWQIYFHKDPMYTEIVTFQGDMVEKNGFIKVRDMPGIGVEINEEGMKKYATPGVPFFE
jgi:galactonate dehydratase